MYALFCGGGTVGHVEPALAIAEILKRRIPSLDVRFVLRKDGKENLRVEKAGYPIRYIEVNGFDRRIGVHQFKTAKRMLTAIRDMKQWMEADPPALVVGTGGYVSLPVIYAATCKGIPTVLHEANATPGLTVRLMSSRVNKILFNIGGAEKTLRAHPYTATVGMPVREDISRQNREQARKRLGIRGGQQLIVSFGGSLGAQTINLMCLRLMHEFSLGCANIHHIHGCGHRYYETAKEAYPMLCASTGRCKVLPYLTNMPELLCAADVVISRSGAATVAELCATSTPSILIPSPNVAGNHQYKNAKTLEDAGACRLIEEKHLTYPTLEGAVRELLSDTAKRMRMRTLVHTFYDSETDEKIYRELREFIL